MGRREHEALVLILLIFFAMILGYKCLPSLIGSTNYSYFFKPLFWLALAFYIWTKPKCKFKGRLRLYNFILAWSAICALIYISAIFLGGFLDGIGTSPYTKDIRGVVLNVLSFGSVIVLMEYVRNYLINRVKREYLAFFSIMTVIIFSLYKLNLRMITGLETWQQVMQYLGEYALPEIMNNILLTYIVYIGGSWPAVIYSLLISLPIWIVPLLPDLKWITKAFIGIMLPVSFMLIIRQVYKEKTRKIKLREQKRENPNSWIATGIVFILLIWFAVGVFPIYPTVILTRSMEPVLYPGDIALIKRTDGKDVRIGDVIHYWRDEIFIMHRVNEIEETEGQFRTKGDNNSAPDSKLVAPEQIRGKLVGTIPKLGILAVLLKTDSDLPKEDVEF